MSDGTTPACPCGLPQDPQVVSNPPGLSQISYRVDDFTGFRRALLRPLPGEQSIGTWQPAPGDLGLQVLDWWAYIGDVLTFYNQLIANESYLGTATRAGSIANLVALIGYQPAPGIAATGNVAATRSTANPNEPLIIPQGMQISSVATPGVPSQTFEVSAQARFTGPSSVPVSLPPDTALVVNSDGTPQSVLLAGRVSGVRPGDQLVLAETGFAGTDDNWSLVTVGSLTPATDPGTGAVNTVVTFSAGGWGPTPTPSQPQAQSEPEIFPIVVDTTVPVFADIADDAVADQATADQATANLATDLTATDLTADIAGPAGADRDIAMFGTAGFTVFDTGFDSYHWAPLQPAPPGPGASPQTTSYQLLRPTAAAALWNQGSTEDGQPVISATDGSCTVHLSAAVRAISPGDMVLFDCGAGSPSALATVAGTAEAFWSISYTPTKSSTPLEIVVAHTELAVNLATLDAWALLDLADTAQQQAVAVRYAFKSVGTIIGVPAANLPSLPATVGVPASYTPASPGASAFLQDSTGAGILVTVNAAGTGQVTLTGAGTPPAALAAPLQVPIRLLLDIVPLSRGTTVTGEVLGSGNAALINQSFPLAKSPLTYLASGNGSVPALAVYVDGTQWRQVPSLYGQAPSAQVFAVSLSPDETATVTFGDGITGARLTTGSGNITTTYRYGSGAASPPAGRLTTISQPQPNLASIQNPVAVSGGADPQAPNDIRTAAPASMFTFGRAISAVDYEVVAAQAPGVSRVAAHWTFDGTQQRTLVTVYVGDDQAAAAAASAALAGSDDPNRPVSVIAAAPIELRLSCTLVVAADQQVPAVVAAATAAVSDGPGGLFSPAQMGIGQRLYRSAVEAALMVPGVVAVHDLRIIRPGDLFTLLAEILDPAALMFFDPGEDSFFDLPPASISILGVSAG